MINITFNPKSYFIEWLRCLDYATLPQELPSNFENPNCGESLLLINVVIYFVIVCEQYEEDKTHRAATRWSRYIPGLNLDHVTNPSPL